ncbi:MAG: NUDIX domain-containing protein [Pseudomonadota bacterium]
MRDLFFFGTLRDRALLSVVVGRTVDADEAPAARLPGHAPWQVAGEAYPILRPDPAAVAEGVVFRPASADEMEAILYYEEAEYGLTQVVVETAAGTRSAAYFAATDKIVPGPGPWSFEAWSAGAEGYDRAVALEAAAELMPLRTTLPVALIDTAWFGIMNRARQRVRARRTAPVLGGIRSDLDQARDVAWEALERPYNAYISVERHRLRHRLFSGAMGPPVERVTVAWGDGVTVLPYDPVADRVLLIEQFRPGPAARRDPNPWCIEVPAGRIDADEDVEAALRREAAEETGVALGRLLRLPGYYPTPGIASEHRGSWIGEADLSGVEGGVHGAADEGEDIRTLPMSVDAALAALRSGAINTGPAQLLLLWLAVERPRLRAAWAGIAP